MSKKIGNLNLSTTHSLHCADINQYLPRLEITVINKYIFYCSVTCENDWFVKQIGLEVVPEIWRRRRPEASCFCKLVIPDQSWSNRLIETHGWSVLLTRRWGITERLGWASLSAADRRGRWWQTPAWWPCRRCSRPSAWRWRRPAPRGSRTTRPRHTLVRSYGRLIGQSWSSQEGRSTHCRPHHTCWRRKKSGDNDGSPIDYKLKVNNLS